MKTLILVTLLLLSNASAIHAQTTHTPASPSATPKVLGLYDEDINSTGSASLSATPKPASTSARATTYLDPSKAPVSGAIENTVVLVSMGLMFILLGIRLSKE